MNEMILQQLKNFAVSIMYGGMVSFWYELFRTFRKHYKHGDLQVHLEDILISFSVAAGFFVLLQKYNYGSIRFYMMLGIVCGIGIYQVLLHTFMEKVLGSVFRSCFLTLNVIGNTVGSPMKIIINSLIKTLKKVQRTVRIVKSRM